jgi:hypothetical protein
MTPHEMQLADRQAAALEKIAAALHEIVGLLRAPAGGAENAAPIVPIVPKVRK